MRVGLLRAVGAGTALYGLGVAVWPGLLARPSGLADEEGRTAEATRASLRPLALREVASGLALGLAPKGPALGTAAALRLAADLGDAALLGRTLPAPRHRRAAATVSLAWASLTAAALLLPARPAGGAKD
ncbi:hypothetical protein [Streptomyces hoynatensis]|uniref:DUF4267 domain-containing protein n=1 Tax=Streptomyces hoynatensis TaxID=1141874 RepID=A0A3A9ZC45_9ACTN|nr:hypothetical protein [Streptomyces hoynatensis]RKN45891.1 hypothetical protein D7294_05500 [Streptomyces hoynatensis]